LIVNYKIFKYLTKRVNCTLKTKKSETQVTEKQKQITRVSGAEHNESFYNESRLHKKHQVQHELAVDRRVGTSL
jgi:hypothetical protein